MTNRPTKQQRTEYMRNVRELCAQRDADWSRLEAMYRREGESVRGSSPWNDVRSNINAVNEVLAKRLGYFSQKPPADDWEPNPYSIRDYYEGSK